MQAAPSLPPLVAQSNLQRRPTTNNTVSRPRASSSVQEQRRPILQLQRPEPTYPSGAMLPSSASPSPSSPYRRTPPTASTSRSHLSGMYPQERGVGNGGDRRMSGAGLPGAREMNGLNAETNEGKLSVGIDFG